MWARKYRPKTFEEVVGQDDAVKILKESEDRVNTFILSGPSGVGKTSLARIYGEYIDSEIVEINCADNNGVDDVRGLVTVATYSPAFNAHRMFILDESHMMTTQAWNALLKVLEESPKSTVWVLCTTEPSKIPQTIQSRAVKIKLKRVRSSDIKKLIKDIMFKEGLDPIDDTVLSDIVSRSSGRVREAITAVETYLASGSVTNWMTTLDIIKYITAVYNGKSEIVAKYNANLENEDIKIITMFISNYITFLLLYQEMKKSGASPQYVLSMYTSIDPFYLDDLRAMQTAIYKSSKSSTEPVADTISTLYEYYDMVLSHYNDFREATESFKVATFTYMSRLNG